MNKGIVLGIVILVIGMSFTGTSFSLSMSKSQKFSFDGNILYVGGNGTDNYTTIQSAINHASDGDTIFVFYGIYYESITVNKSVFIKGIESETGEKPIVDAQQKGAVFRLGAHGSIIDGFITQNAGKELEPNRVSFLVRAKNCTIRNNVCRGDSWGAIRLEINRRSDGAQILNNTIYGSDLIDGIVMPFEPSMSGSDNINISGNFVTDVWHAFEIYAGENHVIYGNYITKGQGILVMAGGGHQIIENTISKCGEWGICVATCNKQCQVLRNNVSANNKRGIFIWANKGNRHFVKDNKVYANKGYGIEFWGTNTCEVISNNISHNTNSGIYVPWGDGFKIIKDNYIHNNSQCGLISETYNLNIINNIIESNGKDGIRIWFGDDNIISNNIISNHQNGILISRDSDSHEIFGNNILHHEYSLYITEESKYSIIYYNNFINNSKIAYDKCQNYWDNIILLYGNYWSDYEERYPDAKPKLFRPGIWDTPYEIPGGDNKDNRPLVKQYQNSVSIDITRDKSTNNILLLRILERFPLLQRLLDILRWFIV